MHIWMSRRGSSTAALIAALPLLVAFGCATGPDAKSGWPTEDVVPSSTSDSVETEAPGSLLRRGNDGFLYVVGGLPDDAGPGTPFHARYSGEWPVDGMSRPLLAAGRIVRTLDADTAVAHLSYRMPETEIENLELTWPDSIHSQTVGKGLAQVQSVRASDGGGSATLTLGENSGVQAGDIYAILEPGSSIDAPIEVQLSQRFKQLCIVENADKKNANCRPTRGAESVARKDEAIFLEHQLENAPRTATIQVGAPAGVDGERADAVESKIVEAFQAAADRRADANLEVEGLDESLEASRDDFHRVERELSYDGRPQIAVGVEVVERDDQQHLVVNYTGIGPAVGSGMVAAPPTGGVDLGPVSEVERADLRGLVVTVVAAVHVYRGQNARALAILHRHLSQETLEGPLRWHGRDQYAMRWGAAGRLDESVWLVRQDRAVAEQRYGEVARLNAAGTLVRLFDLVGRTDRAVRAAESYLEDQRHEKPGPQWMAAVGMLAEMQAKTGSISKTKKTLGGLRKACSDGCGGDLFSYLSSVWWSLGRTDATSYRSKLLADMLEQAKARGGVSLASARLYGGIEKFRAGDHAAALVRFLEAGRIYDKHDHLEGLARTRYFQMLAELKRKEKQKAFEAGSEATDLQRKIGDFEGLARTYARLSKVYADINLKRRPGEYLRSARSVLSNAYKTQRARGSFGKAGESLYTLGSFLLKFGQNRSAKSFLRRAVAFSVSATRFDIAALSHLSLAVIAQRNRNRQEFQREAERARTMAQLADSERIQDLVERTLKPKKKKKREVPSQML